MSTAKHTPKYYVFLMAARLQVIPIGIFSIFHGTNFDRWIVAILFAAMLIGDGLEDFACLVEAKGGTE